MIVERIWMNSKNLRKKTTMMTKMKKNESRTFLQNIYITIIIYLVCSDVFCLES
jgi:hypothetical protein